MLGRRLIDCIKSGIDSHADRYPSGQHPPAEPVDHNSCELTPRWRCRSKALIKAIRRSAVAHGSNATSSTNHAISSNSYPSICTSRYVRHCARLAWRWTAARGLARRLISDGPPHITAIGGATHQQLSLFDAHYDERCFLSIHVFETATSRPVAVLRPGKTPSKDEARCHLRRQCSHLRGHWPTRRPSVAMVIRAVRGNSAVLRRHLETLVRRQIPAPRAARGSAIEANTQASLRGDPGSGCHVSPSV
jgi:DDE family transposase